MFENSAIVLSAGRSGSMLIFQNLARTHYNLEDKSQILRWQTSLAEWQDQRRIFHSHAHFNLDLFDHVLPIFSVRRDIKQTLISHYISNTNHQWHLHSGETLPTRDQITVDFVVLQTLIDQHLAWYQWYSDYLRPESVVIIYEMLVDYLNPATSAYQAIYPNKHALISNWQQTQQYLDTAITAEFQQLHGNFIAYGSQPSQGIYQQASGQ